LVVAKRFPGSASQILTLNSETRTYNSLLQWTHLSNTGIDMQYIYSTAHNNGRVSQTIGKILRGHDWLPPRLHFGRKPCLDAPLASGGSQ
jgi:hypothetical protein